jgi:hypothetical protein
MNLLHKLFHQETVTSQSRPQYGVNANGVAEDFYNKGQEYYLKFNQDSINGKQNPDDLKSAISFLKLALHNYSRMSKAMGLLGLAYAKKGDFKQALLYCKDALDYKDELGSLINEIETVIRTFEPE